MGNHKTRIAKLERAGARSARFRGPRDMGKFLEAATRGNVLCRDGVERPFGEWLKTLPADLAERLARLGEKADEPTD